ncbi:MAG: hypothetical protein HY721_15060 [Planctomycetes bacterium]|nr:hypothetical protein [Planctomycetota bacterium]
MSEQPFGLLELGSNSLKLHLVSVTPQGGHSINTHKFPWRVAHEYFSTGTMSEASVREMIELLRGVEAVSGGIKLSSMLSVATGVFRELRGIDRLAIRVKTEVGIRLRVISGEEEAKLMAKGFRDPGISGPVLLCDLGGATTQWAWLIGGQPKACGSLTLGAIRNQYLFRRMGPDPSEYLRQSAGHCDGLLGSVPVLAEPTLVATGGTARAAAQCLGAETVAVEDLGGLLRRVARDGPPPGLSQARGAVFLPGLVILERLLVRSRARSLSFAKASVRDGMAWRLIQLLGSYRREDLHSTLLLHTRAV